jgi:CRISPR-associated protein Csb1
MSTPPKLTIDSLLELGGPACLIIKAKFEPLGEQDRFQPAGFPEMGHVIYDAPRLGEDGHPRAPEKVCIVDSAASMANHLEALCFSNSAAGILHPDLDGLPYIRCVTDRNVRTENGKVVVDPDDPHDRLVVSSLTEGHRLASDYFLHAKLNGAEFRDVLRHEFGIVEIKKDKTYFVTPENWWSIFRTVFRYDPNSLIHGIFFAREQIRISRLLTAHLEAFGASRVGSAGVKFDRLGKTTSGQPIFSRDEETAQRIEAIFLIDLGLLRSFGHGADGLNETEKRLLLHLILWKIERMLSSPYRFRSGCHLKCIDRQYLTEDENQEVAADQLLSDVRGAIKACKFPTDCVIDVYYPAAELFNPQKAEELTGVASEAEVPLEAEEEET